jgi:aspartyl-tRNA(Asn)/glutamyl-tRNA(Gln) amidotransferase subunit A
MMDDWLSMTAADLGRGIGAGKIDPVDLSETYLAAINRHDLTPRIYARTTPDRARAEAKAAQERAASGMRRSALDGVPISWKDLFDTAGTVTEAGTKLLAGRVPDRDARVLANATAAGLVCLGKTHMTELAFSGLGLNPMTETPPCVNDAEAAPGGSSSGAATSVAFGLAAAAIGSDTGGSVRIPSVWNDLVGLKTTSGRVSLEGVVPLCPRFDTVGPLCRSLEDAGLLLAALEGGTPADLTGASLSGLRFLALEGAPLVDAEPQVIQAYDGAVELLSAAGATVDSRPLADVDRVLDLSPLVFASEAYGIWKDAIEANPEAMFHQVRERFRGGAAVSAPEYIAAWRQIEAHRAAYLAATAGYDAVILPTCPILPPNVDRLNTDNAYFIHANLMALRNTRVANLLGLCALTLPLSVASTGLMLMGAPGSEARLLRIGAAVEGALA